MSDFDFLDELKQLGPDRQERFKRVVSRLLGGETLQPGADPLAPPDPDWRFLHRHRFLVDSYLRIGGWEVEFLEAHRIARARHQEGRHRVRFNLLESMIACVFRQVYHEQMAEPGRDSRCELSVGDLRERLAQAQHGSMPIPRRQLSEALRKLCRHGLASVSPGFAAEEDESIAVNPLIEAVLSPREVQHFYDRYTRRTAPQPAVQEDDTLSEDGSDPEQDYA